MEQRRVGIRIMCLSGTKTGWYQDNVSVEQRQVGIRIMCGTKTGWYQDNVSEWNKDRLVSG